MKILLATDGSRFSVSAARYVAKQPALLGRNSDLLLLNVDPPLPIPRSGAVEFGLEALARFHAEASESALKPVRSILKRARIAYREKVLVGEPATVIAQVAKSEKCDLIIMGSHGRSSLQSLFLGSVTAKVIARSAIPVLIVR